MLAFMRWPIWRRRDQSGIGIAPVIPGLTTDIPECWREQKNRRTQAFINMLRLPAACSYFEQRLRDKLPIRQNRILNRIAMRAAAN